MKNDSAKRREDESSTHPQRYAPRYIHNVRAVPQTCDQDRDIYGPIPFVMLRGTWLRKLGFEVGVHLRIEAIPGQITLRTLWRDAPSEDELAQLQTPEARRYVEVGDR
jgi:toxic protein SymE